MNTETNKLLQQIATKLGTTIEHLWDVLLKQSQVQITKNVLFIIFTIIFVTFLIRRHRKLSKNKSYTDESGFTNDSVVVPMFVGAIVSLISIGASVAGIFETIDLIFNPEYWALKEIISNIK